MIWNYLSNSPLSCLHLLSISSLMSGTATAEKPELQPLRSVARYMVRMDWSSLLRPTSTTPNILVSLDNFSQLLVWLLSHGNSLKLTGLKARATLSQNQLQFLRACQNQLDLEIVHSHMRLDAKFSKLQNTKSCRKPFSSLRRITTTIKSIKKYRTIYDNI